MAPRCACGFAFKGHFSIRTPVQNTHTPGLRLINFGIAAEATVGKYVKIERLPREVKILYAFAYVFAASEASAAKCSHTEGAQGLGPGPQPSV